MTTRIDILSQGKEEETVKIYMFSDVIKEVKEAIASWKAMGQTAVVKDFKEKVKKL